MILSIVSVPRTEPMRPGVHLPQDSMAQNSSAKRAWLRHVDGCRRTPRRRHADQPVEGGEGFVVERRVEQLAAEVGASGPPT
jgi:hypothetical protein